MIDITNLLMTIQDVVVEQRNEGWLVGGTLRDRLLGRATNDLDIAVTGDVFALAHLVADRVHGSPIVLDRSHPAMRITWRKDDATTVPLTIDLVQLRGSTIQDDLRLRDFTINALAVPLSVAASSPDTTIGQIIDPCGGLADHSTRLLRACSSSALRDDPLRMLRAIRVAGDAGFHIDPVLRASILAQHAALASVASERIRDELLKILALPTAGRWLRELDRLALLTTVIPELWPARGCHQPGGYHWFPVLDHMLESVAAWDWIAGQITSTPGRALFPPLAVSAGADLQFHLPFAVELKTRMAENVESVPRAAYFRLALLMHDIAKPQTRQLKPDGSASFYGHPSQGAEIAWNVARRLRIGNIPSTYIRTVVNEHMRPGQLASDGKIVSSRAIYRFFSATGDAGPDVLLHMLCDYMGMRGPLLTADQWGGTIDWVATMLNAFYRESDIVRPISLVNGHTLMTKLNLGPGPLVGTLLAAIREAQAAGEVTTVEQALHHARALLAALPRRPD
ncbi:MAG: CCA tRNA nucleotidyltransferase [Herpetosiphon sp.]